MVLFFKFKKLKKFILITKYFLETINVAVSVYVNDFLGVSESSQVYIHLNLKSLFG